MGYTLSEAQLQVIEADARRIQVLATAGSGKTTTLTVKIGYTISVLGISAQRILALSYSKASAMDFRHRFLSLFEGKAASEVHFSTLHAFALGVVRKYWSDKQRKVVLVDSDGSGYQRYSHIAKVYHQTLNQFATKEVLEELFSEFSYVKNAMCDMASYRPKATGFMPCYLAYESEKQKRGLIDFDDMLLIALEAFRASPPLLQALQQKFTHFFVDESQDINPVQIALLELLCAKGEQWVVIGDDDQSIYGFRAADPSFLINFGKEKAGGEIGGEMAVQQVHLGTNYRCASEIVSFALSHIEQNKERLIKPVKGIKERDDAIRLMPYTSLWEQVEQGVEVLKQLLADGVHPSEIALLVRNHYALVAYLHVLLPMELPIYIKDDQLGFYNHWVVRDAQLYLSIANGPLVVEDFLQLLSRLKLYISQPSKEMLYKCSNLKMALDLVVGKVAEKGRPLAKKLLVVLTHGKGKSLADQLDQFYDALGYRIAMVERASRGGYGSAMPLTIWETYKWMAASASDYEAHLANQSNFERGLEQLKFSKKGSGISLMSLHGSKGLEFEHVLIGDLEKHILPAQEAVKNVKVLEEERRLFYVGVTRAKHCVYLLYPKFNPSPFVPVKGLPKKVKGKE